ncbi:Response regulator receiver [Indibacter alkaliphilus LW1]|uniref:Response regulator receiver n=2 Tax=Indibacter TaxID=647744 RepID=S2DZX5_INDAL|nr:Response regulator receiver [Indibacter alkaliphilus LW1]
MDERKIYSKLSIARDGQEALDFVYKNNQFKDAEEPDLILLDINLPKRSGNEVLQTLKSDDKYKHIPILMLTTSSSKKDIMTSYRNYANSFITKPVEVDQFQEAMASVEDFWLQTASLPKA